MSTFIHGRRIDWRQFYRYADRDGCIQVRRHPEAALVQVENLFKGPKPEPSPQVQQIIAALEAVGKTAEPKA